MKPFRLVPSTRSPRRCRFMVLTLLLSSVVLLPSLPAQAARPEMDDAVKGPAAAALLRQVQSERAQLINERRDALARAEEASTPEDKLRILQEIQAAQRERKARLKEDAAKVRETEKLERAARRAQPPRS